MPSPDDPDVGVRQVVPLLAIRSMDASLRFYVDGLGFRMTNQWIHEGKLEWCWLQHGDGALMLQEVVPPAKYARELEGKAGLGMSLNFMCRDALAFYRAVTELLAWVYRLEQNGSAPAAAAGGELLPLLAHAPGVAGNSEDSDAS